MAIAFRSVGARAKADISATGNPNVSVSLPAGHVSGDTLVMFVLTDGNTNTTVTPAGWTRLTYATNGTSTKTPYAAYMQLKIFYRIDNGSLGSTVGLTFTTAAWPAGNPYVLAFVAAYSGCDPAGPVEQFSAIAGSPGGTVVNHPQVTTATTGDWLLSYRASSSDSPAATFTNSVGTDTERVDDSTGNEIASALYDSNASLTAGLQTQRTTTASRAATYGSLGYSIVLKPPPPAGSTNAAPAEAIVAVTAYNPTVVAEDGPWELCEDSGLPTYQFAIDWDGVPGPLTVNYDFEEDGGWTAFGGAVFTRSQDWAHRGVWSALITTGAAAGPRIESDKVAVTEGRLYRASGWVLAEDAFPAGVGFSVNWYDAGGGYLSTSSNFFVPPVGAEQYADGFFPAPAGAAQAGILLDTAGTPGAGLRLRGDEIRLDDWSALVDPAMVVGEGEDVTGDIISDVSITYGRDQERQLSPAAVGSSSFTLVNDSRKYSPENVDSPLYGDLDPARTMRAQVTWSGQVYPLFRGRIEDYTVKADFGDRAVDLTFLDGMNDLSGNDLSTGVYASMRTGSLIHTVLDEAGWTGGRDIDPGATVVKYWWVDGTDALSAIQDLVKSEGPPAVAYVDPSGTFVFRDRHHRMLRQDSRTAQALFHAGALGECTEEGVPSGALSLAKPFSYAHGWKDIVNSVTFSVPDRAPAPDLQQVWQDTTTYTLALGQSLDLTVNGSDPFVNAVTPVLGTDVVFTGAGTVGVLLSRTSGASAKLTLQAIGGTVTITSVQVRAQPLSVQQTHRISLTDAGSITRHGERTYPNDAPWAGPEDARAIANMVLLHYASRRPTVQIRVVSSDPAHFAQVLSRTVSDRIHITNDEMRLDDDFFVERVTHTVRRIGRTGRPPVHAVVLGCEKDLDQVANPFTFDVRGAGFDQGVFDPLTADDASQVFIFDDPVQGVFDFGEFGT